MSLFLIGLNWVDYSGHLYLYGEEKLTWEDAKVFFGSLINV